VTWTDKDLRDAALAVVEPPPRLDVLRDRVLARRGAGERVQLPVAAEARARGDRRGLRVAAAVAVGALLGTLAIRDVIRRDRQRVDASAMLGGACGIAADDDSLVAANDPSGALIRAGIAALMPMGIGCHGDTTAAPPVETIDVARIRPMRLSYVHRSTMDTMVVRSVDAVSREVAIVRGMRGTDSAWVINNIVDGERGRGPISDSLYFGARDLRPLRFTVARRFVVDLERDRGVMHQDRWRAKAGDLWTSRDVAVSVSPGARRPVGPMTLELAVQVVPLAAGWSGSMPLLRCMMCVLDWPGRWPPAEQLHPTSFRVLGDTRVTVPAGSFDTWTIAVSGADWPRGRTIIWVDKTSRAIVRTVSRWADADGDTWVDETVLTKTDAGHVGR
jgi:hypothetical protein